MLYADDGDGERIEAEPRASGNCPACGEELIAKCGEIRVWHRAHRQSDCDAWYEPESNWHLGWKRLVEPASCEVAMGDHRADIVGNNGVVIKLQHSTPSPEEAREREQFFRNMIWLFNATPFVEHVELRHKDDASKPNYRTFRWKWPRPTHARLRKPLYWDLGRTGIFRVGKVYDNTPCGGWGFLMSRQAFIQEHLSQVLAD